MMKKLLASLVAGILPLPLMAQAPTTVPPGTPVTITVTQATPAVPDVSITLGARHGHVTPVKCGCNHTGGGNIDIQQPTADTVVVTMSGVCVAAGHPFKDSSAAMNFDLEQCLEISIDNPKVKKAKLTIEGRVIGLLRSECKGKGSAEQCKACATIGGEAGGLVALCVPPHGVAGGENLSLNCHEGPTTVPVIAGKYTLHECFGISASHGRGCGKASSAEFAPDPALDPLWISYWEPFHGAAKKDFGYQVTIKVAAADDTNGAAAPEAKPEEKVPAPKTEGK